MLNSQSADEQRTSFRAYLTLICTETHQSLGGDDRIALIVNIDELALDTSLRDQPRTDRQRGADQCDEICLS